MSVHSSSMHTLSDHAIAWTRLGIVLSVLMTALATICVVQWQSQHHHIVPEQLPIADMDVWKALGN